MYLPEELLVEILPWVPAASLARFRCTAKRWNALIKSKRFAEKHSAYAPRQSSLVIMLIDSRAFYTASFDFHGNHDNVVKVRGQLNLKDPLSKSSEEVYISDDVFHCDGLLLCTSTTKGSRRQLVWNPCSGETRWMVAPKPTYSSVNYFALGKSSCNKYKVLRVGQYGNGHYQCGVEYEIYDFTSNSWRSVGNTNDWSIPGIWGRGVSVNGNTYWLAFSYSEKSPNAKEIILSFDFSTESFGIVSLPFDLSHDRVMALSVTREEQKLCLLASPLSTKGFKIDLWMATKIESSGATSWSKFLTVERDKSHEFFTSCNGMSFLDDREKGVLVCPGKQGNSKSFLHIVGEDKYIQVDHHDAGSKCSLLISYVPTLVRIQ
ncbi:unnamed protein product [Microthlaspi erraticum]|uniref:F-box domain-containing protein n=1 Tax=Microthlaspi erraticum TaxID=1685480 RepID=A0A6D2IIK1_9BRAS|nr:unnamed protein product [Microthlaspi erraticum]